MGKGGRKGREGREGKGRERRGERKRCGREGKCGLLATSLHCYLQGLETTCPPCENLLFCFSEHEYEDSNPSESHDSGRRQSVFSLPIK